MWMCREQCVVAQPAGTELGRADTREEAADTALFAWAAVPAPFSGTPTALLLQLDCACGTDGVNSHKKKNHLEVGKERSFPLDKDNQILRNYLKRQSCLSDLFGCSKHGAATPPSEGKAFFFPPPFALLSKQPDGLTTKLQLCPEAPVRLRAEEKCHCGVRGLSQRLLVHQTPPPDPTQLRQPRQDARCAQSLAGAWPKVSE